MAAKLHMLKLLQEIRGFAELSRRRAQPRPPGLLLTHIRSHTLQGVSSRRKLNIQIDPQDRSAAPCQVKISHVKQGPEPAPARPTP